MNISPIEQREVDVDAADQREALRAAELQAWLRQLGDAVLVGWPAACLAAGRGLPDPVAIGGEDVDLPDAVRRWQVWSRQAGGPPPPAGLPIDVVVAAPRQDWLQTLRGDLGGLPVSALQIAITGDGTVIDAGDGLADVTQARLRLVGAGRERPRIGTAQALSLAVLAAWTGWTPTAETARSLRRDATAWMQLDRGTWRRALHGALLGPHAGCGLQLLADIGALVLMVPEATAMMGFHKSCSVHHKDIWAHTLEVIEKCPQSLVVRWSALMHDTGKILTRTVSKGKVHFFGHEAVGAMLMQGVAARLELADALRDRVTYVIAHHARANAYLGDWTDSAVRRLVKELGEHLEDVLAFSRSDWSTKRAGRIAEVKTLTRELATRIPTIVAADSRVPPLPKGLGTYVLAETGLAPGPWLGRIQQWLEAQCDAGTLLALQEPPYYLTKVRELAPELLAIDPGTERQRRLPPRA